MVIRCLIQCHNRWHAGHPRKRSPPLRNLLVLWLVVYLGVIYLEASTLEASTLDRPSENGNEFSNALKNLNMNLNMNRQIKLLKIEKLANKFWPKLPVLSSGERLLEGSL